MKWILILLAVMISSSVFAVNYYVNDGSTNGDVYCTATGSVANAGTNAAAPAASLKDIVDDYDLDPGDVVYVDAGYYYGPEIRLDGNTDTGSSSEYLYFLGSTNPAAPTILRSSGTIVFNIYGGDYVIVKNFTIRNAIDVGFGSTRSAKGYRLEDSDLYGNLQGVRFHSGNDITIKRCVFINNTHAMTNQASNVKMEHCVLWSNSYANSTFINPGTETYSNCVFVGGSIAGEYTTIGYRYPRGDYNVFWDISFAPDFSGLNAMQKNLNDQWHSTYANPHINYVTNWTEYDFHPKSLAGRYNPATSGWVTDAVHSVLIDFGPTNFSIGSETAPNGNRLNAGYYGGTDEASRSVTNPSLLALTYNQSGGVLIVPGNPVYWRANNIETDATVRIEFLTNNTVVTSFTNIPARDGGYTQLNSIPDGTGYLWRVVLEQDESVNDTNAQPFEVILKPSDYISAYWFNSKLYYGCGNADGGADIIEDDGGLYTRVYDGDGRDIKGFAVYSNTLYAVEINDDGSSRILSFNGTTFSSFYNITDYTVLDIDVSHGRMYLATKEKSGGGGRVLYYDGAWRVGRNTESDYICTATDASDTLYAAEQESGTVYSTKKTGGVTVSRPLAYTYPAGSTMWRVYEHDGWIGCTNLIMEITAGSAGAFDVITTLKEIE